MKSPKNPERVQFKAMSQFLIKYGAHAELLRLSPRNFALASECLGSGTPTSLEKLSGISEDIWRRWQDEMSEVNQVRDELGQELAKPRSSVSNLPDSLVARVRSLCSRGKPTQVARCLGLPRKTLASLMRDAKVEGLRSQPSQEPESLREPGGLEEVQSLIARHRGKVRRKYSQQEKRRILEILDLYGSSVVHKELGVSFDTLARWQRRRQEKPEVRKHVGLRYIPVLELMREHPGMGPMQIRDYLRRHKGLSLSVNSIRRVMEDNGWVPPYARITRDSTDMRRYEAIRRNYLWHLDFKHHWINSCKAFILFVLDDHSRFIVGHTISDAERIESVIEVVDRAIALHGKPEVVMSDGGSAFRSWRGQSKFTSFLEDYGIDQLIAKTPNVNGKSENLHQQLEKEVLLPTRFSSLEHCAEEVASWVGFFNFMRPHQGLGDGQTPADRYHPGVRRWFESKGLTATPLEELLQRLLGERDRRVG